ncbi:MAG: hypothetical protein KAW17_11360 [Candidatus Eisenbacteria sp.]|nr:hypothetical protein [Candidatus Eisenbacteria bacterium]
MTRSGIASILVTAVAVLLIPHIGCQGPLDSTEERASSPGPISVSQIPFPVPERFAATDDSTLFGVGFVDDMQTPVTVDLETFQYTWVLEGVHFDSLVVDQYGCEYYYYTGGTFRIYEDSNWNAFYSDMNCVPPDWTGEISNQRTFRDGEMILGGEFRYLVLDYFPAYGFGYYSGVLELTEGTHLFEIPEWIRYPWFLTGPVEALWGCVPDGYELRFDGQLVGHGKWVTYTMECWGFAHQLNWLGGDTP